MLNTYNATMKNNNSFHINAVCGTLVKNYKESYFLRFQLGSALEKSLLNLNPYVHDPSYGDWKSNHHKPVVVLQVMCAGGKDGDMFIAEVIDKEVFDKLGGTENYDE
jgi:hypothetical protein